MKRTIYLSVLLLFALSLPVYPQTSNGANSLPKLLSVREQQLVRESWLKKRLDTMLLPMMRQQKIEMWIVVNEEFHADPVTAYIAPPLPYVGRRDYFIFADREGSYTSIELNTSTPVPEWAGQKVTIMMEDDAYLTKDGMKWFRPRQTEFYVIR